MNAEMTIRYCPALGDQIRASLVHYRGSAWRKCDRIAGTIAGVAGLTLLAVGGWHWWLAVLFPMALADWTDVLHLHTLQAWVAFKRNPKFRDEYTLTFADDGLRFTTVTIDSKLAWSHYDNVIEDAKIFLLRYGKSLYTVVPKRAFKDQAEQARFRTLLQSKIPNYNKQRC
jgi:hypothetical protein